MQRLGGIMFLDAPTDAVWAAKCGAWRRKLLSLICLPPPGAGFVGRATGGGGGAEHQVRGYHLLRAPCEPRPSDALSTKSLRRLVCDLLNVLHALHKYTTRVCQLQIHGSRAPSLLTNQRGLRYQPCLDQSPRRYTPWRASVHPRTCGGLHPLFAEVD